MTIGQSAGKSYAYLLGVYLGDGCISTDERSYRMFRVNTIDEDFALAIKAALNDVSKKNVTINKQIVKKSSKPNYALTCCDQELCKNLLFDTGGDKSRWPLFTVLESEKAFVIGLMDSEGFVAEKTAYKTGRAYYMGFKSCDSWVLELVKLMQSIGLKIGKVSQCPPYRAHYKVPTRFHIKMQSWVDSGMRFNIKRKQDRVDRWARTEPYSERLLYPRKLTSETARQGANDRA